MTKINVMCNILNEGTVSAGLESQLMEWMRDKSAKYRFTLFAPTHRPISNNRNRIVKRFLEGDWDMLFMLDDDNPPIRNPFDLLDFDKDVIGAIYPGRDNNGIHFHVYKFGKEYPKKMIFNQYDDGELNGLSRVDALGTGCMFVKRHVLEKIKRPFEDLFDEDGCLVTNDDMHFCHKCKQNGIEVWTHTDYMCSHYKTVDLLQMAHLIIRAKNGHNK